jgi:DNA ligase (NAD+)
MPSSIAKEIARLREALHRHDRLYFVEAAPEISDREYDGLMRQLRELESAHPELVTLDSPTQRVGGLPLEGFAKVTHAVPMLSVDNTYDESQLREFDQRIRKALGDEPFRYVVDPKVDGVAASLRYERGVLTLAATRGDGVTGDDVTANVKTIRAIPLQLAGDDVPELIEIRGEVYWPTDDFTRFNAARQEAGEAVFANPRNATAGTLKQLDPQKIAGRGLRFVAHGFGRMEPVITGAQSELMDRLKSWGVPVSARMRVVDDIDGLLAECHALEGDRHTLAYEIDGLVAKVDAFAQRDRLGQLVSTRAGALPTNSPPSRARACCAMSSFKWASWAPSPRGRSWTRCNSLAPRCVTRRCTISTRWPGSTCGLGIPSSSRKPGRSFRRWCGW